LELHPAPAGFEMLSGHTAICLQLSLRDEYRQLKSTFVENVLASASAPETCSVTIRKILFKTTHFRAELLSPADLDLVVLLNNACRDFFLLQNGQPPSEADAREVFESVPPQGSEAIKLPIGIFDQFGKLVGLIDVLRGYRTSADWYIGLMLLAPGFQGQGFGTEIHNEFVNYARREGVQRLLLAVLEANESARRFWLRLGYRKVKDFPSRQFGKCLHGLTEFEMVV
jgi:RimJ/RimL family protein N-acetyltransferase